MFSKTEKCDGRCDGFNNHETILQNSYQTMKNLLIADSAKRLWLNCSQCQEIVTEWIWWTASYHVDLS